VVDCARATGLCHSVAFIEPLWGQTTRNLVWSTKRLKANDWTEIMNACTPHLRDLKASKARIRSESESDGPQVEDHSKGRHEKSGLHSQIQIDW
jgi:hypothetical protein